MTTTTTAATPSTTASATPAPALPFNPAHQDAWEDLEKRAREIPPMPHFWAAGAHAGILRRKDLKAGYDLLRSSVGGFGSYIVDIIPQLVALLFAAGGLLAGFGVDLERPGGWFGDDAVLTDQLPWTIWHTLIFTIAMGALGYLLGYYIWQPLKWYNSAWGDCLAMQEMGDDLEALLRTKLHRLTFCSRQALGYYRGNARGGHIAKARILLCYTPTTLNAEGQIVGGHHTQGLSGALMTDLYEMAAGVGHSTDDPGRAYESLRVRMRAQAEKARQLVQRGMSRYIKLENGLVLLAIVFVIAGLLNMMSLSGGGSAVVDTTSVTDTIGVGR